MNETQQRIKAYQEMLPSLKEKVVAMALLLALSLTMVTSASFAWLTISKAPAVTGVNTTVAANGALEIALVNPEGTVPGESKVGDSFAAEGQNVVAANMTWGNLINLSDPSYGLNHLALRPAQLNYASLLVSPLYGAMYDGDGRITQLSSNFGYGTWNSEHSRFMITNDKGVRAISSVTIEAVGFAEQVYQARSKAEASNLQAGSKYLAITQNGDWMNSLSTIMGTFMTARMNSDDASVSNPTVESKDVQNLTDIFEAFIGAYEAQADAMVDLANYQLFLLNNSETGTTPYTKYTRETLLAKSETTLEQGVKIVGLNQLKTDLNKLYPSYEELLALKELGSVSWADSGISDIVNKLMDVGTCKLDDTPINNIGVSNAMGYLDGNTHNAYITNGLLFNFEKINGAHCEVKNLEVSAKVKRLGITIPASISVNITTTAPLIGEYSGNLEYADGLNQGAQGERVAQDTYGLAIDLWVRTNAEGSYLTLEGNVLTETKTVRSTGKDANGNEVELYTLERTSTDEETGETSNFTAIVYKEVDENGRETGNWISANNYAVVELADGEVPIEKYDEVKNVIGYEGVNRIWAENDMLSTDSTSQGSGSCYVYYADTPEDQAQSLRLLESFNVAFIDDQGEYLANAYMDTTEYYAENGRVIVPLKLDTNDSINLGTDYTGETTYAITALQSAVPKRITAIVYLDGTKLTNDDVLAAADIQGQLNIQFGSSTSLVAIENEKLENAIRRVTASVDKTKFNYDTATEPMTTTVTLNIEGEDPTNVTAFFMRA
ncbi:MAG: hypothetical protein IJM99_00300, partial [Firmicutes bacterium]|nr:hypothetical protein [Bacillota bacterium]